MTLPPSLKPKQKMQPQEGQNFPSSLKKKSTPSFDSDEDLDREIERNQAQFTSRMLERIIGLPGDIASILPGSDEGSPGNPFFGGKGERPSTSAELRQKSENLSQGFTKPKNNTEEATGDFMGDVASFMIGGVGKNALTTTARAIGIPLAGQLVKEGILGDSSEGVKGMAKVGTMLLLDLWGARKGIGGGGAYKFGLNKLESAEKSIPKGAIADVSVFNKKLESLQKSLKSGITGQHTAEAERVIKEIKNHTKGGKMSADKFPQIRKDINTLIDNMKGFQLGGPSASTRRVSVKNLNDVKSALIQAGNRWGRGNSPQFFKEWREGNEALAVYHKSNQISSFVKKHTEIKSPFLKALLGIEAHYNPIAAIGLGLAKGALNKGTQMATSIPYRFFQSKVLRNLYSSVLKEAAKGNAKSVVALSSKLEEQMKKEGLE